MNLTSVKYQDSCIFIGLNGSQNERENEALLQKIRSVYVVYKVKAFGRQVRETILIGKEDLFEKKNVIVLRFELKQLLAPEQCEIEIASLKFNYLNGKVEELKIKKSFPLSEIRCSSDIDLTKKSHPQKPKTNSNEQPKKTIKHEITSEKRFEETKITPGGLTIIEDRTPVSSIVAKIESKVQSRVDAQTKKLDADIKKLCYEAIDLLLSNLPQPELVEEYRASNAMVKSIHRYINTELLQNEFEGGESA